VRLIGSKNNVIMAPGHHKGYLVTSESEAAPNFVVVKPNGACICQCTGYRVASLCSHSLAVAEQSNNLEQYLVWFHQHGGPNLTAAASATAPKNTGRKPGQQKRVRNKRSNKPTSRNDGMYTDRNKQYNVDTDTDEEQIFQLKWLKKNKSKSLLWLWRKTKAR
jgi:hypothetical protein